MLVRTHLGLHLITFPEYRCFAYLKNHVYLMLTNVYLTFVQYDDPHFFTKA